MGAALKLQGLPDLTDRQREILDFIRFFIASRGYPPTVREIGAEFDIRSTNGVADHLASLERKGYLHRGVGAKSRAIRVLDGLPSAFPTGGHAVSIAAAAVKRDAAFESDDAARWEKTHRELTAAIEAWRQDTNH